MDENLEKAILGKAMNDLPDVEDSSERECEVLVAYETDGIRQQFSVSFKKAINTFQNGGPEVWQFRAVKLIRDIAESA
ncbi:MAG: hypothetical protein INR69_12550 [Mucilaginibacter polytrichastri]|nr:hypothetical protein [Mucilaginibacter polytrichastri]